MIKTDVDVQLQHQSSQVGIGLESKGTTVWTLLAFAACFDPHAIIIRFRFSFSMRSYN